MFFMEFFGYVCDVFDFVLGGMFVDCGVIGVVWFYCVIGLCLNVEFGVEVVGDLVCDGIDVCVVLFG